MRIDYLTPENMNVDQRRVYDNINSGERGKRATLTTDEGALVGPFNAWLYSPDIGDRVQLLGEALRFHNSLPQNLLEVAILMVGRKWRAQFEWWAHALLAQRAGVSDDVITDIKNGIRPEGAKPEELIIYDFCRDLLDRKRVSDENFQRTKESIGENGVVDLVCLMGYYTIVSMTLNVFDIPLPEGQPLPFEENE
jgi:4-carboxymuconolactone decarboxylase